MSRTNRLARALVAVRPFPLTDQMKRVVEESVAAVRKIIQGKIEGKHETKSTYTLWDGTASGPVGDFHLIVEAKLSPFAEGPRGYANVDAEKKTVTVHLEMRLGSLFGGGYEHYLESPAFLTSFSRTLHHELIHAFDIKVWSTAMHSRLPEYPNFYETGDFEKYIQHPFEVSAYGGESYYFFKNKKEEGVPLAEAVKAFLSEKHSGASEAYREVTRRGDPKLWHQFLTRVHKSAEQAYADVAKEQQ